MKTLIIALLSFASVAFAETDLVLPDARHLAIFDRFVCNDFNEQGLSAPAPFAQSGIRFEKLVGDGMILQFLITATYPTQQDECRYSALLIRGRKNTLVRKESKAYPLHGTADCSAGKAVLDETIQSMAFTYDTKPITHIGLRLNLKAIDNPGLCNAEKPFARVVFLRQRK